MSQSSQSTLSTTSSIDTLQAVSRNAALAFNQASTTGSIAAALQTAEAIGQLRNLLDTPEIKSRILSLQDTSIGFRTDRDPKIKKKDSQGIERPQTPYGWDIVRDALVEGLLRGLQLVGNQINIISGKCYCTKEGFEFLIRNLGGVSDFNPTVQVPRMSPTGAVVECSASWTQQGKPVEISAVIPVKTTAGSTPDQIIGKAQRKLLKRCYERMTGSSVPDGDESEIAVVLQNDATSIAAIAPSAPSSTETKISGAQLKKLADSVNRVLSKTGMAAFDKDVCACFSVEKLADLPADQFTSVMQGLANDASIERWNRGCASGNGELIIDESMLQQLQGASNAKTESLPSDSDTQEELI